MSNTLQNRLPILSRNILGLDIPGALAVLAAEFPGRVVFSSSFSNEDQVVTDFIRKTGLDIGVFTLDTGRLFPQTISTWVNTNSHYEVKVEAYFPDYRQLEGYLKEHGPDAFYASVDHRKTCCYIRKVAPLQRALADKSVWITGLRSEHSPSRNDLEILEWDEANQVIKYNPILHWTTEQVWEYVRGHRLPYNVLHDQGFVSIGCAPCTRAIRPGEDFRAGRWWWEDAGKKECGLHVHPDQQA
jgi:phosphoadenosine phosphosulfate reductase